MCAYLHKYFKVYSIWVIADNVRVTLYIGADVPTIEWPDATTCT